MAAQTTKSGQTIGNVGVLDLRTSTDEGLAGIARIGNVGEILYAPGKAHLVTKLSIGNIGSMIEVPEDARYLGGQEVFTHAFLTQLSEPVNAVIAGSLIIEPDVTPDDIEQHVKQLIIAGTVICPEPLQGSLHAKIKELDGVIIGYQDRSKLALVMGQLDLDESYLNSLADDTELIVMGRLTAHQKLPSELIAQKLQTAVVMGRITCREENADLLRSKIDATKGGGKFTIIPAGFEVIDQPLVIDNNILAALPGKRLYCLNSVRIADDVDPTSLDEALDTLQANSFACPVTLQETMRGKYDPFKTRAIFYEGELWLVENETTLLASRFNFLADKATLMVTGLLTIAPEVEPQVLADRLAKVYNYGLINASTEQIGALQARLAVDEGLMETDEPAEDEESGGIGNTGYLKL